jgi:hypothetical protein
MVVPVFNARGLPQPARCVSLEMWKKTLSVNYSDRRRTNFPLVTYAVTKVGGFPNLGNLELRFSTSIEYFLHRICVTNPHFHSSWFHLNRAGILGERPTPLGTLVRLASNGSRVLQRSLQPATIRNDGPIKIPTPSTVLPRPLLPCRLGTRLRGT